MSKQIRVIIIESSPIIAAGLKTLLTSSPLFSIVTTFTDIKSSAGRLTALAPDVLLLNPNQLSLTKRQYLHEVLDVSQQTAIVALLSSLIDSNLLKPFDEQINIYDKAEQIYQKIRASIEEHNSKKDTVESNELSERETEILVLAASGLKNKEIAEKLNISVNTVISHRKNISQKTGIKSVAGLTVYALYNNLIDIHDVE